MVALALLIASLGLQTGVGASQNPAEPDEPDEPDEADAPIEPDEEDGTANVSISIGRDGVNITPIPGLDGGAEVAGFTEKGKDVPVVEVLHRLARTAGWSLTLVGVGTERIDVDFTDKDPRDALREILESSKSMGVLRRNKLVVISASGHSPGLLIESHGGRRTIRRTSVRSGATPGANKHDMVNVLQGDLVVPRGTVLSGDAVAIWGSVDVEAGAVVEGSVAAIGGSVNVAPGAVVLGDGVAILGSLDVERGGQVLGEHVQVGLGKLLSRKSESKAGLFSRLGPFGLFPSLATFALFYLLGLGALHLWPERVRAVGAVLLGAPVKSFFVGFLCWLLLVPVVVLLCISLVGIALLPLLPLVFLASIGLGLAGLALRIGERLPTGPGQTFVPPAALGMGLLVILLASFVPWLGTPLLVLLQFVALGAVVSSRFGRAPTPV